MKKLSEEWLEYAGRDLEAALVLNKLQTPPFEIIAYHCHQSAEKNLKAVLIENNLAVPRTHDLKIIVTRLIELDECFNEVLSDCNRLTPFGVITRYPGSFMIVGDEHVGFAISAAERIADLVHQFLSGKD